MYKSLGAISTNAQCLDCAYLNNTCERLEIDGSGVFTLTCLTYGTVSREITTGHDSMGQCFIKGEQNRIHFEYTEGSTGISQAADKISQQGVRHLARRPKIQRCIVQILHR